MLGAIGPAHAEIRPIVAGVLAKMAILVKNPGAIRRPACPEIQMIRMPGNHHAACAIEIAGEDAVAVRLGPGGMEREPRFIGTETEAVRKALARARDFTLVS